MTAATGRPRVILNLLPAAPPLPVKNQGKAREKDGKVRKGIKEK